MSNEKKSSKTNNVVSEPINRPHTVSDKFVDAIADKFAPTTRVIPMDKRFAILTSEQKYQLEQIEERAVIHFSGQLDELESALGMLRLGHHLGWKVLYMIHSKKTIRKYEEILDVKIRDIFQEKGPSADRSVGLNVAERFSNFWKVVSGEIKVENRREIV